MIQKNIHLCILILVVANGLDLCKEYQTYQTCIGSLVDKCIWDNIRNICYQTNDYLQGCSQLLNKKACLRQIGDVFGQLAKCRFTTMCEEIPDLKTEKCYNNLSKSGCLSIQNIDQVCIWKNDQCIGMNENDWNQIQDDFDKVLYSASACPHIEHYLVMHHTVLWDILSYTPDLLTESENVYKQELGIEIDNQIEYDDPTQVLMQNNYIQNDGTFSWYTIRESKSITLTNLQKTYRYREGCIALEIESDSDFTTIFSLTGEIRGVNHIYCKYLNQNPSITDDYVFSQGSCKIYLQDDLNNQDKIEQYNLNCYSIDQTQCIYFDSLKYECIIQNKNYEYPCVSKTTKYIEQNIYKTNKQCKELNDYYIDNNTNTCINTCLIIKNQVDCEQQSDCLYLGIATIEKQLICSPKNGCDQIGISQNTCQFLKAQCGWNIQLNRCYSLTKQEISYLKCNEAFNLNVCILITLSDQMCYWDQNNNKCINIIDQPLLITHQLFIDFNGIDNQTKLINTICNINLCKYNSQASTEYNKNTGYCQFNPSNFISDLTIMNKYRCINDISGYCKWNLYNQICECLSEQQVKLIQCNDLIDVNEKLCQKALVSNIQYICVYDSQISSCIEKTSNEIQNFGCSGHGLSEEQCVKKNIDGQLCQYSAGLCVEITTYLINSIRCTSLQKVNAQVCKMQSIYQSMCKYDDTTHSCYSPSIYNTVLFDIKINRYACQAVQNSYTYYDEKFNICVEFYIDSDLFYILTCEYHYVNKQTCIEIKTSNQHCFWDDSLSRCRNYSEYFNNCDEYSSAPSRVCTALSTNMEREFMKENYCTYTDNICQISIIPLTDCGTSEYMNIHRCGGYTGYNNDNTDIVLMCAFINDTCIQLDENNMDTYILLNNIQCQQANLKACQLITTKNQFCQMINTPVSTNIIIDKKCKPFTSQTKSCFELQTYININKNFCASASDECYYDTISSQCDTPQLDNLDCNTEGLSKKACISKTNTFRCAIYNNSCGYLSDYYTKNINCSDLNQFICEIYAFKRCSWDNDICIDSDESIIINSYSCSVDQSNNFKIYNIDNIECQIIDSLQYQNYNCDYQGLNIFGCSMIPNQYCQYYANKCQFYQDILCEDSNLDCGSNNSKDRKCVKKDDKCFELSHKLFQCDYFDETNYEFCFQYPECIYVDKKCQQRIQITSINDCNYFDQISCLNKNKQYPCTYINNQCETVELIECPSLNGYYSQLSCIQFINCLHGYTKSGLGFCYNGQSFNNLTCEELPQDLCIEDLYHLNNQLKCYWDITCKTLTQDMNCSDLQNYQSNYIACKSLNDDSCKYSFQDKRCKFSQEYNSEQTCNGLDKISCSKIKLECYYTNDSCTDSGLLEEINKFGCIKKDGLYQFLNYTCKEIIDTDFIHSCENLSKQACLRNFTKDLHCRWYNDKCENVLQYQNKRLDACNDLNQRSCQDIRLSNLQCYWDDSTKECLQLTINNTDCTESVPDKSYNSLSLCSGQTNTNCVKNYDNTSCSLITQSINDCNLYGMNMNACISLTTVPCQWIVNTNNDGYCDSPNLFDIKCTDILNKYACLNIKQLGQFCNWNNDNSICENKIISDCNSANKLNGDIPCKAITTEACRFNYLTNECKKPEIITGCQSNFNLYACQNSQSYCSWENNTCIDQMIFECTKMLSRQACLANSKVSCQWYLNKCIEFLPLNEKIFCIELPQNISNKACQDNAKDPCNYDNISNTCYPSQQQKSDVNYYEITVVDLLQLQISTYESPLLIELCENLKTQKDCINSRKQDQSCIWNNNQCQILINFDQINCNSQVNIYGCLNIIKQQQYCFWRNRCLNWNKDLNILTNVNINVCVDFSINSIYEDYSCKIKQISNIDCLSIGISKITCISIINKQCQWNQNTNSCDNFNLSNQQKCSDFQLVSPYVCQKQNKYSCTYDYSTNNCKDAQLTILESGISMQACFKNLSTSTYWNGESCNQLIESINCDQNILVNPISCQNITNKACYYDKKTNKCTSIFNINSLKCDTIGLNLQGCTQVITEPCIFINQQCQKFENYSIPCMTLSQVNAKACASLVDQQCFYNEIDYRCRSPLLNIDYCNIKGINQNLCQNNQLCQWNSDNLSCKCKQQQESIQCNYSTASECKQNTLCYFQINQCVKKQCYHLTQNECLLQTLDGKSCYLNINNECQPANKCEDIIDPKIPCGNIYINSIPCVQARQQCISGTNYELFCPYSDCSNSNCYYEKGICRIKICNDYNSIECIQHDGCYLTQNNICEQLNTCSQISQDIYGNQVQSVCNQLSVNGFKCNWQQFALLDDTEVCTNQPCELYGPSNALCQGNEMNGYSCVLTSELICKQCEQITEQCFCNSQESICKYSNGKCQSIQCSSFITKDQCSLAVGRCYWSKQVQEGTQINEGCVKECIKIINADECNNRIDECYYESLVAQCKKGKKQIPDLSTTITIEPFYSNILISSIILSILIQ